MRYRVKVRYTDVYTWELRYWEGEVGIASEEKARKWASQTFFRGVITKIEQAGE